MLTYRAASKLVEGVYLGEAKVSFLAVLSSSPPCPIAN